MLLSLAYVLPFLTGQIPEIGKMLCPMHLPVMLCGFICGWPWGAAIGFLAPLMRSLTLSVPPIYPKGICMALELMTYGLMCGIFDKILPKKRGFIYVTLLISMVCGRLVWGAARFVCTGLDVTKFGLSMFMADGVIGAIPGIIAQIVLVPVAVMLINKKEYR